MFVAFRSDWIHEVKPVTSGRRYSIVTWFIVDDESGPAPPPGTPPISQERRNDLNRALHLMLAKMRCRGHALSCFLDAPPSDLIPRRRARTTPRRRRRATCIVNSSFRYAPHGEPPDAIRGRVTIGRAAARDRRWRGSRTRAPASGRRSGRAASGSRSSRRCGRASRHPPRWRPTCARRSPDVGVLVPPAANGSGARRGSGSVATPAHSSSSHGYAIVRDLHPSRAHRRPAALLPRSGRGRPAAARRRSGRRALPPAQRAGGDVLPSAAGDPDEPHRRRAGEAVLSVLRVLSGRLGAA